MPSHDAAWGFLLDVLLGGRCEYCGRRGHTMGGRYVCRLLGGPR